MYLKKIKGQTISPQNLYKNIESIDRNRTKISTGTTTSTKVISQYFHHQPNESKVLKEDSDGISDILKLNNFDEIYDGLQLEDFEKPHSITKDELKANFSRNRFGIIALGEPGVASAMGIRNSTLFSQKPAIEIRKFLQLNPEIHIKIITNRTSETDVIREMQTAEKTTSNAPAA